MKPNRFHWFLMLVCVPLLFFSKHATAGLAGDFDGDGQLTDTDIDLLHSAYVEQRDIPFFDLTDDGRLTTADSGMWIEEIYKTWVGDTNLDGEFNSADFVLVFVAGKYETDLPAGWAEGDWAGDKLFNANDLVHAF